MRSGWYPNTGLFFPSKDQNGVMIGFWQRLGREELTWQGSHPCEKGGLKLIFEGEAEKTLTTMEKPNTMEAEWDKDMEAVPNDSRILYMEESKFKSHGPMGPHTLIAKSG